MNEPSTQLTEDSPIPPELRMREATRLASEIGKVIKNFGVVEAEIDVTAIEFLSKYAVESVGGSNTLIGLANVMTTEVLLRLPPILDPEEGLLRGARKLIISRDGNRIIAKADREREPSGDYSRWLDNSTFILGEYPVDLVDRIDGL